MDYVASYQYLTVQHRNVSPMVVTLQGSGSDNNVQIDCDYREVSSLV